MKFQPGEGEHNQDTHHPHQSDVDEEAFHKQSAAEMLLNILDKHFWAL